MLPENGGKNGLKIAAVADWLIFNYKNKVTVWSMEGNSYTLDLKERFF